mgnify:CR=1 FL=1
MILLFSISKIPILPLKEFFFLNNLSISIISFFKEFKEYPNHLSLLSYDLIGLIYYLSSQNSLSEIDRIFKKKNSFKGKIGIFDIENNKINHRLNLYQIKNGKIIEIF